jgi:copper homeostasis protein
MGVTLEIVAVTIEDAVAAEKGGADRLELIANFLEGGTTPSPGIIRSVKRAVSIPVNAMIRPHGGGFVYSELEIQAMVEDAFLAREAGVDGVVVGALRPDGTIDAEALNRILEAGRLPATFHRAFDTLSPAAMPTALDELAKVPWVERVLTSGGHSSAYEGRNVIADLVSRNRISIMPGKGVGPDTLQQLVLETGVREVHVGSAARESHSPTSPVSERHVRRLREILYDDAAAPNRGR